MNSHSNATVRLVLIPVALTGALLLGAAVLFPSLRLKLGERISGNNPEARVRQYVRAVLRGQEATALEAWELFCWQALEDRSEALAERRAAVTRELVHADLQGEFLILNTEWWRTCCEPGVISNPLGAGGARVRVQFIDGHGLPISYIFDVFHRDGPYWGSAMGYPTRHWVLRDIYPLGEEPLYWRMIHVADVRQLPWPSVGKPTER
jgi:hypothetical protein